MIHLIPEAESLPEPICDPPALPGSRATDRAMTNNTDIVFPPAARHAQAERGSARAYEKRIAAGFPDRVPLARGGSAPPLHPASPAPVPAAAPPYTRPRGGQKGFKKVRDEKAFVLADSAGNRQYITLSNLAENDRAYLFL